MIFQKYLETLVNENTSNEYFLALLLFLGLLVVFGFFKFLTLKQIKKSFEKDNRLKRTLRKGHAELFVDFFRGIKVWFYIFIALLIALKNLETGMNLDILLNYLLLILIGIQVAIAVNFAISEESKRYLNSRKDKNKSTSKVKVLVIILKFFVWVIALLTILSNLGLEVTGLIAGLGIGGIAIALALQTVLADLFASFSIYFDKPFEEGDFIIIGSDMGTVKEIGVKTTRIETLQGQELVISNSDMTNSRINNYKKMKKRRVVFDFGVTYDTSNSKLKKINKIVEKIVKKVDLATLDRVNFKKFADSSLNYEVVYYIDTSDYNEYMNVQEKINLELKKELEKEKIVFAFPTRTVHLGK